ncbi:MAG TPA: Rrf2 family transcriptional regulator [Flavisolibacter sp.]|jgi:Rrf2 family protein|nr:Rrf2 family transcriptional regulator [Flavisolibacter sp.]
MKITAQEEYGLRILIRIAACRDKEGMSIPQLSEAEGLTPHYVAKLTRILRIGGFVNSTPGKQGGYILARPAMEININEVLKTLGGALFDASFCGTHSGAVKFCTNSVDCSSRSLWQMIQFVVDQFLDKVTLYDLVNSEGNSARIFHEFLEQHRMTTAS